MLAKIRIIITNNFIYRKNIVYYANITFPKYDVCKL